MKQSKNNEIDLLLRSLAREAPRSARLSPNQDQVFSSHLDADELSAYAEGALPAAARTRYTAHLADCARCRHFVTQLASAVSPNIRESIIEQKAGLGFWQKIGAVLSPAVLRFAVPAVVLLAVVGISFMALRQTSRQTSQTDLVARNEGPTAQPVITETVPSEIPKANEPNLSGSPRNQPPDQVRTATPAEEKGETKMADSREVSKTARSEEIVSVTSEKGGVAAGRSSGAVAQPPFAPEPAAAPQPKPQSTIADTKTELLAKDKSVDRGYQVRRQEDESARRERDNNEKQVAASKSRSTEEDAKRAGSLRPLKAGTFGVAGKKADDGEVRTVGGRQFRRQGHIWIDTAYQSSAPTTIVARGSEQYRALVADEPGIRTIAEQLSGEVVLVWKGRAYRIR